MALHETLQGIVRGCESPDSRMEFFLFLASHDAAHAKAGVVWFQKRFKEWYLRSPLDNEHERWRRARCKTDSNLASSRQGDKPRKGRKWRLERQIRGRLLPT